MLPIIIQFQAFIPKSLGKPLLSYFENTTRFKLLSNKDEFTRNLRRLDGKGYTWLPEPGGFMTKNFFATDDVEMFHHHSEHTTRLAIQAEVNPSKIGNYHFESEIFKHPTHSDNSTFNNNNQHSGLSHQVQAYIKRIPFYTDMPRASDKDMYIGVCRELNTERSDEDPLKTSIKSSKKHFYMNGGNDTSEITVSASAEYPFLEYVAPNFENFLYNKWMSASEQYSVEYLKTTKIVNQSSIDLKSLNYSQPLIFSSFHFGSFRLFNSFLYELGHKIVILIDDTVLKQQKDDLIYKVIPLLNAEKGGDFIILSVQDRNSIFKLKQLISNGYIMTVYLDGNSGVGMKKQDFKKSFMPINFLKQEIYVKKGISKLSVLLNAKIVPVISYREDDEDCVIEFHREIGIDEYENKQDFIKEAIERSYKILENKIYEYPSQFTSWLTLHNLFMRNYSTPYSINKKYSNKFNDKRYTLFTVKDSHFIFDLLDYQSYPIENVLVKAIKENNFETINTNLKLELQQKNIII